MLVRGGRGNRTIGGGAMNAEHCRDAGDVRKKVRSTERTQALASFRDWHGETLVGRRWWCCTPGHRALALSDLSIGDRGYATLGPLQRPTWRKARLDRGLGYGARCSGWAMERRGFAGTTQSVDVPSSTQCVDLSGLVFALLSPDSARNLGRYVRSWELTSRHLLWCPA